MDNKKINKGKKMLYKISHRCRALLVSFMIGILALGFACNTVEAAQTGYTDHGHKWSQQNCTTCGGDHKVTCPTCGGERYSAYYIWESGYRADSECAKYGIYEYNNVWIQNGCKTCGGSGQGRTYYYDKDGRVAGWRVAIETGTLHYGSGTVDCTNCYASGNNLGKQEKCTNSNCKYFAYGTWRTASGYSDVCYSTANQYTFTVNPNGGAFSDGATSTKTASPNLIYDGGNWWNASAFVPTRTGYTFKGFYDKTSGGTKVYNADGTCVAGTAYWNASKQYKYAGNLNVYAQWTHNPYTVTYNANGGELTDTANTTKTYFYNDAVDLSPTAEMPGKIFIGWSTQPNAIKAMDAFVMPDCATSSNADYKNDWEVTLYAVYTIPVSDVANHSYPDYEKIKEQEVYFRVWEIGDESNLQTYPLTYTQDVVRMEYRYQLQNTDVAEFVKGMASYGYEILAFDNAGNYRSLYQGTNTGEMVSPPPTPVSYLQTVNHYKYDKLSDTWKRFDVTRECVLEGILFTPTFITAPEGYCSSHIDEGYIVIGEKTSNAYYVPIDYKISFEPNGGVCDVKEKTVTYEDYYGSLPIPTREGYTFTGWYTEAEAGTEVLSSHKYKIAGDSTLYAHWKRNSYKITYDYWTNGGVSVMLPTTSVAYDVEVDLTQTAEKEGWKFVGWNTDSQGYTAMDKNSVWDCTECEKTHSMSAMPAHDITLYAIYKKDITLTIVEQTDEGQKTRGHSKTIYNTETQASFPMTEETSWTGWDFLGWTNEAEATATPIVGVDTEYAISDSMTLYGVYISTVTLSYDTNGSSMEIPEQTKECYYNASGDAKYPEFVIADAPVLSQHSFVNWQVLSGNIYDELGEGLLECIPGNSVIMTKDCQLKAIWDEHPKIEAYDRYFTLQQAQSGYITEEELLKKIVATDLEDGVLVNGVDVIILNYEKEVFTAIKSDAEIDIIYQATDSFGNCVEKTIVVHVTNTTMKKSQRNTYVRFISSQFYRDAEGEFFDANIGGVGENSKWRTQDIYIDLLEKALYGDEEDVEIWTFTRDDRKKMKKDL